MLELNMCLLSLQQNRPRPLSGGFTLVEISIVMIIIGLLIGGIFGGMKLVDNANIQKTVQDLKSIESATLTFKDTYRRLPGDITNPSTVLPYCTDAPCSTGGNGDRAINNVASWNEVLTATMEKFTFWHHLRASNLLQMGEFQNTTTLGFGDGEPAAPAGGGYRVINYGNTAFPGPSTRPTDRTLVFWTNIDGNGVPSAGYTSFNCGLIRAIDQKMDDGAPYSGIATAWVCSDPYTATTTGASSL